MTKKQEELALNNTVSEPTEVEKYEFEPIQGYPMLNWRGKRPFRSTQYYPAQLKEVHGPEVNGWRNKIYWGDNLQVMSHLLKEFRGKINLVYIDPPFDSKANYKTTVSLKKKTIQNDQNIFEEMQYADIWANDEYLQYMYERLSIIRELLSNNGFIFLHCDWHKSHYLRLIMDELFGQDNFRNEIIWVRSTNPKGSQHESSKFSTYTDTIFCYAKSNDSVLDLNSIRIPLTDEELAEKYHRKDDLGPYYDGPMIRSATMGERQNLVYEYKGYTPPPYGWRVNKESLIEIDNNGNLGWSKTGQPFRKLRPDDDRGKPIGNLWDDISLINSQAEERLGYPTQKPIDLLKRIISCASKPSDLVLDCFMGSGTTQISALELGRKFIGADINLGGIQISTERLINFAKNDGQAVLNLNSDDEVKYTNYNGFEIYNVNYYDIFRNPVQAKVLLIEALEIQKFETNNLYDGEKDGRMVKIMPVNRITTRADLNEIISGFDYKSFERRQKEKPNQPVEKILIVCMGHEADLVAILQNEVNYKLDIEVVDILRDKTNLEFKRDAEAKVVVKKGKLVIAQFYPMNLLQKLSLLKENVEDWREMVESVMVDWNYDGAVLEPAVVDLPDKDELVSGEYPIPKDAGTIRVKITDLLSESLEVEIHNA